MKNSRLYCPRCFDKTFELRVDKNNQEYLTCVSCSAKFFGVDARSFLLFAFMDRCLENRGFKDRFLEFIKDNYGEYRRTMSASDIVEKGETLERKKGAIFEGQSDE